MSLRPAAVAGVFYPDEPRTLAATVRGLLEAAPPPPGPPPKALIAPHAGYVYSGPVAAAAYRRLEPAAGRVRRVVLLGPAHRVYFRGLALPESDRWATPLGVLEIDREAVAALAGLPGVIVAEAPHEGEHALEVQLPFLQAVFGDATKLVPLVVGDADARTVAAVLDALWDDGETLMVVSSDLSHYLPYEAARRVDEETARRILALEPTLDGFQACGCRPVNGLLATARRRGMTVERVAQCNSGDTAGDRRRVVGYGAFAFYE